MQAIERIIFSYEHIVKKFRNIRDLILREDLHSAAWEGLVEGIMKGIDGRIPLEELYNHLGPYAYSYIKSAVTRYWELHYTIRVPRSSIREGRATQLSVISIQAYKEEYAQFEIAAVEEYQPAYTHEEIVHLLKANEREQVILQLLSEGKSYSEIGKEIKLSKAMICVIVSDIRRRAYRAGLNHAIDC